MNDDLIARAEAIVEEAKQEDRRFFYWLTGEICGVVPALVEDDKRAWARVRELEEALRAERAENKHLYWCMLRTTGGPCTCGAAERTARLCAALREDEG